MRHQRSTATSVNLIPAARLARRRSAQAILIIKVMFLIALTLTLASLMVNDLRPNPFHAAPATAPPALSDRM
jgi:hypothetical protein